MPPAVAQKVWLSAWVVSAAGQVQPPDGLVVVGPGVVHRLLRPGQPVARVASLKQ